MTTLKSKRAVVLGGSTALGLRFARAMIEQGAEVLVIGNGELGLVGCGHE
jgi:NAD(P)-dependent dehydrogenase (short-subunit alcohol dehydrogenase family)